MTFRTAVLSSVEAYLTCPDDSAEERAEQASWRSEVMTKFPHAVMLQVAFPELDFANRWCWSEFGPADGVCMQKDSEYRVCQRDEPHSHSGVWTSQWFTKTDYNFGFNEWYFVEQSYHDLFLDYVPEINWGEKYPK